MAELVSWIPRTGKGRLGTLPRPRGEDWLEDDLRRLRSAGVDVLVSLLTADENEDLGLSSEAAVARQQGIECISFPVDDRCVPTSVPEVRELITPLRRELEPKNRLPSTAELESAAPR